VDEWIKKMSPGAEDHASYSVISATREAERGERSGSKSKDSLQ
jgi:hypothetical protein